MTPEAWLIRAVTEIPATRRTCLALLEHHGAHDARAAMKALLLAGSIEKTGSTRKARYRVPVDNPKNSRKAVT